MPLPPQEEQVPPEQHPAALLGVSLLVVEVVTVESAELRQMVPGMHSTGGPGTRTWSPGALAYQEDLQELQLYCTPLGYKNLLVVQLAVTVANSSTAMYH